MIPKTTDQTPQPDLQRTRLAEFLEREELIEGLCGPERAAGLVQTAELFLRRFRASHSDSLQADIPLSRRGLEEVLEPFFQQFTEAKLLSLLAVTLAVPWSHAYPVSRVLLIPPANVVVAGLESLSLALLAGCRKIIFRLPRNYQSVFRNFYQCLSEVAPELSRRVFLVRWSKSSPWPDGLHQVERVVAYGADESLDAIQKSLPRLGMIGHGHQMGVALVYGGAGEAPQRAAQAVAGSMILHEQRGCLSPRLVLIRAKSSQQTQDFARRLFEALKSLEEQREADFVATTLAERGAVAQRRNHLILAQCRGGAGSDGTSGLFFQRGFHGTVEWHWAAHDLTPDSPLLKRIREGLDQAQGRMIPVVGIWDEREGADFLGKLDLIMGNRRISVLGCDSGALSLATSWLREGRLSAGRTVPLVCPIERMQSPPIGFPLDGRPSLFDFLTWSMILTE
jgi:hypothetical protein